MNKQKKKLQHQIALLSSRKTDHWQTPPQFLTDNGFELYFDPCPRHPTEDGLKTSWNYERVFVNPPYSQVGLWLKKAHEELLLKHCRFVVFLVFANTDTKWFHEYVEPYLHYHLLPKGEIRIFIEFIRGRLKFVSDDGVKNSAMRPNILLKMWCRK